MADPEPQYAFSIPSLADDLPLQCRIYHPKHLSARVGVIQTRVWGAIMAHPYAPLGGSFDDPVVISVVETLLLQGHIVGTFNFRYHVSKFVLYSVTNTISRGAAGSEGHTTWSGRAEQEDYISFAGFLIHYLQGLHGGLAPNQLEPIQSVGDFGDIGPISGTAGRHSDAPIGILLGGYSYGSLVLARLPSAQAIYQRFANPKTGSAAAEVALRARTMAEQTKIACQEAQSPSTPRGRQLDPSAAATSPSKRIGASPMTMGGEETDLSTRRRSRDSRRSVDVMRKSIEAPKRIRAHIRGSSISAKGGVEVKQPVPNTTCIVNTPEIIKSRYLVISPVLIPFTHTLCPPGPPSMFSGLRKNADNESHAAKPFLANLTLALFGSSDVFTASKRLKAWAQKMVDASESKFAWEEIDGAGHFWNEAGVMQALQRRIEKWLSDDEG
jgi:alpha/beta superfamily hydrolase